MTSEHFEDFVNHKYEKIVDKLAQFQFKSK